MTGSRVRFSSAVLLLVLLGATGAAAAATPRPPKLTVRSVSVAEGQAAIFVLRLSRRSTRPVRVGYRTDAGDATSETDFTPRRGQLVFNPGQRAKQIVIATADDDEPEDAERFYVVLSSPIGVRLETREASGTITPNDLPSRFSTSAILRAYDRSEPGSGAATVAFDPAAAAVSFTLTVRDLPENAFATHIHPENPPWRGPDAMTLFPNPPSDGTVSGAVTASRLMILEIFKNPSNYAVHVHASTRPSRWLTGVLILRTSPSVEAASLTPA